MGLLEKGNSRVRRVGRLMGVPEKRRKEERDKRSQVDRTKMTAERS